MQNYQIEGIIESPIDINMDKIIDILIETMEYYNCKICFTLKKI